MSSLSPQRVDCIQALRAMAALAVVGQHLPGLSRGAWGVDLFFLISGFIVCYVTAESSEHFLLKRLIRVVPLYWLGTLLVFGIAAKWPALMNSTTADPIFLLKSLFFIPFAKNGLMRPILFLGWTLNYEMFFYGLFAVSMAVSHRQRAQVCALLIVALVLAASWLPTDWSVLQFYGDPMLLEFALGMLTYTAVEQGWLRLGRGRDHPAVVAVVALGFLTYLFTSPAQDGLPSRLWVWGVPCWLVFVFTLRSWGTATLAPGWLLLGDASYSLYLFHPYVVQIMDRKLHAFSYPWWAFTALMSVGTAALCCLMAVAVYRWIEVPVTQGLRRALLHRPVARQVEGVVAAAAVVPLG